LSKEKDDVVKEPISKSAKAKVPKLRQQIDPKQKVDIIQTVVGNDTKEQAEMPTVKQELRQ